MNHRATRRLIGLTVAFAVLVLLPILSGSAISFYTDWLWFESVGQLSTLKTRLLARIVLWLAGALLVLATLVINWFFLPRRLLGRFRLEIGGKGRTSITIGIRLLTIILSVIGALVTLTMASAAASEWKTALRFIHVKPFGLSDPIFGFDAGFYVFKLPFYRFVVGWVMSLIVVALMGNALVYALAGRIREGETIGHLSVLGALFLVGKGVGYQLQRWALLESSTGVVYGAGYTDVHAQMPLLSLLTGVVILGALLLLVNIFIHRWRLLLFVGIAWLALSLVGQVYPAAVQRFTVEPNELALERPYIAHNIRFTRYAYGLEDITESDYRVTGELTAEDLAANQRTLDNVRLWDWKPLRSTYEQIQEIRTYYTFFDVDIDRYTFDDRLRQVNLAVRELDTEQIREDARTWINQHLIYTHGYGLCLSPVGAVSEEGLPQLLVRNIPPESDDPRLEITRPEIYFGEMTHNYVIVDTTEDEFDYPSGDENVYSRYEGSTGVRMGGILRRMAFALRFQSSPILLSNAITSDSRILFDRALSDRVTKLAPMLLFDADPYPVIVDGRIVWLYDAYTWSARFPYSRQHTGPGGLGRLNYIRNSIKVTVDAYTGETTFYVVDPDDPLIQTYRSIFPDLFTPLEEMDPVLRQHWRYPEQLFLIQSDLYAAYHMQDPRVFYNQEDLWQTPTEVREADRTEMSPYYVTIRLPAPAGEGTTASDDSGAEEEGQSSEHLEFMLIRPYVPAGKQNMIAWLYADSDGPDYGQLGVFKFSKEALVYGPMQVESRIDQDASISQQLTLWNQRGSSVNRGNLIVIPIDGTLLYVEPLYLQAEESRLPELKRVVVVHKNRVAMANTLSEGLAQVLGETPVTEEPGQASETEPALPRDAAELARSAQAHYEAAQRCLEKGDWACYGDELEALERDLQALIEATEE
jgi:uncharacterized membrane protein (UPF0182 family)